MKNIFSFALVLSFLSFPAFAGDTGGYVGLNYGKATASGDLVTGLDTSHSDTSYGLYGGYQFSKNFAAELLIVDMGALAQDTPNKTVAGGIALTAVGMLPASEQFTAFAKLGYARTHLKSDTPAPCCVPGPCCIYDMSDVTYGLGIQYNFTEAVGARASYDSYKVGKENSYGTYTVVSAGVVYKF